MLKIVALARLRINTQAASEPVLTEQELDDLLSMYALEDADGLAPDEVGWSGTWDMAAASRKGWLLKAGKVVSDVTYQADGASYSQSDMHAHCMAMAQSFGQVGVFSLGAS
jgi:hypothetical protein